MPSFSEVWHRKAEKREGGRVYIFGGRSERREQIVLYYTSVFDFCDCAAVGSLKWGELLVFLV